MKTIQALFALACAAMLVTNGASAKERAIGKPKSVVHVQEITSNFQVLFNYYCPVRKDRKFQQHCKRGSAYNFKQPTLNPNVDWVKVGKFKYMVQWVPARAPGTYAWTAARGGLTDYGLKEETQLIELAPGTVMVDSPFYVKGTKAQRAALMQRVKAMFAQKYGAVAKQMKFRMVQPANVKCLKRREAPKDGYNCTLR